MKQDAAGQSPRGVLFHCVPNGGMQHLRNFRNPRRLTIAAVLLIAGAILFSAWYARERRLVPASFKMLNDAQTIWYPNEILHYRIVVDVIRPGEARRNEIHVANGEIVEATVRYRRPSSLGWGEPSVLNTEQAYPFTIPGLYDMVRLPLRSGGRQLIRVDMRGNPPFPHEIVFEPVWENGVRVMETKARVVVRRFTITPEE